MPQDKASAQGKPHRKRSIPAPRTADQCTGNGWIVLRRPRSGRAVATQADSALRDFPADQVMRYVKIDQGEWFNAKKVELIDMLNTFLVENFHQMKQAVLVVADAHNLSMKVLEEIRLLSGVETTTSANVRHRGPRRGRAGARRGGAHPGRRRPCRSPRPARGPRLPAQL